MIPKVDSTVLLIHLEKSTSSTLKKIALAHCINFQQNLTTSNKSNRLYDLNKALILGFIILMNQKNLVVELIQKDIIVIINFGRSNSITLSFVILNSISPSLITLSFSLLLIKNLLKQFEQIFI